MSDDLERRLRRADPARSAGAQELSETEIRNLMEAAMQQDTTTTTTTQAPQRRSRWLVPAAAAAAVLIVGGVAANLVADDSANPGPNQASTLELNMPGANEMTSCLPYSVRFLADMPTAFSGTVVEADGGTVVLDVDKWYRGGDTDQVQLVNPDGKMTSIGGVDFVKGDRYLVTAAETHTVNSCGYTADWTGQMAADFEQAFGN